MRLFNTPMRYIAHLGRGESPVRGGRPQDLGNRHRNRLVRQVRDLWYAEAGALSDVLCSKSSGESPVARTLARQLFFPPVEGRLPRCGNRQDK